MANLRRKWENIIGLSIQLAKSSFKLKTEGSYLGILWYLIEPLLFFVLFLTVRNLVAPDIEMYPLYLLLGLMMFNFFRRTTGEAVGAISGNSGLIGSLKLNNEVFVVSIIFKAIYSHFFEIILFIIVIPIFGGSLINIIFYPLIFLLFIGFTLGVSLLVATIGIYLSDFGKVWGMFTRLLWFATPIFYTSKLASKFNLAIDLNAINPIYYFITFARELIVYNKFPGFDIIIGCILFSLLAFFIGLFVFNKYKHKFSEVVG